MSSFSWRPPLRLAAGGRATGCHVDRFADALIGAAAADVGHRRVNVLVGRPRVLLQERRRRHDLAGPAVAALRHVDRRPGLLHRMRRVRRKPLDGDDLVGGLDAADRDRARAHHFAVDVHRAGAALRDAAAVFGAREADMLADDPQERRVVLDAHVADLAVDVQLSHVSPPSTAYGRHIVLAFCLAFFGDVGGLTARCNTGLFLIVEESLAEWPGAAYAVSSRSKG